MCSSILLSDYTIDRKYKEKFSPFSISFRMRQAGMLLSRQFIEHCFHRMRLLTDTERHTFEGGRCLRTQLEMSYRKVPRWWFTRVMGCIQTYSTFLSDLPFLLDPIKEILYFEPLLYAEPQSKWYKDHIYHQLRVTKLLFSLIEQLEQDHPDLAPNPNQLRAEALIAGLFHDIGYPLTLLRTLSCRPQKNGAQTSLIFKLDNTLNLKDSGIENFLEKHSITTEPLSWIEKQINSYSTKAHAYLSGLWILSLRQQFKNYCRKNALDMIDTIFDNAALAAFVHHLYETKLDPPCYLSLKLKRKGLNGKEVPNPLPALLQLADAVQEWGRPIVIHTSTGEVDYCVPNEGFLISTNDFAQYSASPGPSGETGSPQSLSSPEEWLKLINKTDRKSIRQIEISLDWNNNESPWTKDSYMRMTSLVQAGWKPWLPCFDVPIALKKIDPVAVQLLFDLMS